MKILLPILALALGAIANATDKDIESLIEHLASPNAPLNPKRKPFDIPIPPSYDQKAQERIERTVEELKQKSKTAFPYLIKNRNDRRYCRSYPISILNDFTVGETCMEILGDQIDYFKVRKQYLSMPKYSDSVIGRDPAGWWKKHSSMSVNEMRIEALQWTINAEKAKMNARSDDYYRTLGITRLEWEQQYLGPLLKLLNAEQPGAAQPATQPADKAPVKDQPSTPTSKDAPR